MDSGEENSTVGRVVDIIRNIIRKTGYDVVRYDSVHILRTSYFVRLNARRLEHLASLRIPVAGLSVLEVGAGIGEHSSYYIDRGCRITITEARPENLRYLEKRYPGCAVRFLDMEDPAAIEGSPFDIVHCYGLLYHLSNPERALSYLGSCTGKLLFLETCVSFGESEELNPVKEDKDNPISSYSGTGCRPTRKWLYTRLLEQFAYVYLPKTQPSHEQFPTDWTAPEKRTHRLTRAVFIASKKRLDNELLTASLPMKQTYY
ncbi:MAG: class I SAM-dependent methyltransferase [Syntrophaceae bacterium]|nr:class I SAM-dependent methyltransferase [Syntrophaceae bacterium]